jgi:hypothetical protein
MATHKYKQTATQNEGSPDSVCIASYRWKHWMLRRCLLLTSSVSYHSFPLQNIFIIFNLKFHFLIIVNGAGGSVVVKALCYKPEGRGFETP